MENKKLVIGLPTVGTVPWQFASCLMSLQLPIVTRVIWMVRSMIDASRNNLVKEAMLDPEYTHILMIDDDMTFEPDLAERLLKHDVDIVGGLAFKRRPNFEPCVYSKLKGSEELYPTLPETFQEVDAIGTGGILIKLDVFKKLKYPWFETYYDDKERHWSVDMDFCIKAKKAGFKIFCDPEVPLGHIGDPPVIGKRDFLRFVSQETLKENKVGQIKEKKNNNVTTSKNNNK